jgi:hypothetical protein
MVPLVVLCALIIAVPSVWAYWVQGGVALCTATGDQQYPTIVSDGAGGAIVTWQDNRSGNLDIYTQRVNFAGDIQWMANGVALCTATGSQGYPTIVSDGAGGAIVTWIDNRNGNYDIYAQRVHTVGIPQWAANGVAICTAAGNQGSPQIISDGAGGAIVTWADYRSGNNWHIYAQRVNASGTVQWTTDGVAICTATGPQYSPTIASDGAGGAIVTWYDLRSVNYDIYAQRVNASGVVQWAANGVLLSTVFAQRLNPTIISDGLGGAIVTWQDSRNGNNDIYAQRLNASGSALWTANGVALCTATGDQNNPIIVSDGAGGAIVTWRDYRSGSNFDLYAQRVSASGIPLWTVNGVAICTAAGDQQLPQVTSDGAGGAVVTWYDNRSGNLNIYAQRVNASGAVQWTANGVALCTGTWDQSYPTITSGGVGGAIVTWYDYRSDSNYDIYAQSVDGMGRTGFLGPTIRSVRDVRSDQGGKVLVTWDPSRADVFPLEDVTYYTVWRSLSAPAVALLLADGAESIDPALIGRGSTGPAYRLLKMNGALYGWELIGKMDSHYLSSYSFTASTLSDSMSGNAGKEYFFVSAHTSNGFCFWDSKPDSGCSVDNLSPCPPQALAGQQNFTPVGLKLTWDHNTEADLGHYAVYRGTSASFVPGAGNLIASPSDTVLLDSGWRWSSGYYYKVSAIDIHGNESDFALLTPDDITGNETPKAPAATYLAQNYPNPFNPTTRIAFGLSEPGHVSLRIYDVAGRLVRTLAEGNRPAANYAEVWDGKDTSGRAVASGIYFCRLDAGSFSQTKKMILLR